jgi:hypothetical protein
MKLLYVFSIQATFHKGCFVSFLSIQRLPSCVNYRQWSENFKPKFLFTPYFFAGAFAGAASAATDALLM